MSYSIETAFDTWVNDNPDNTAVAALGQLEDICAFYYVCWVNMDSVEYRGIKGGSRRAYGSGRLNVDLLGEGGDDPATLNYTFPFDFEFLLAQDGTIQKAERFKLDLSEFTGRPS
ncbi:MAG TPA: hypothetical protein VJ842_05090 [Pyrinomonadaceae bacterium]|nr:hypothetical protein [Pyrinomonadaceae bacterium]